MINHPSINMTESKRLMITTLAAYVSSSSSFLACNSGLRSAIRRYHPPQRAVLSQICCFGERKMVMFQILLDGAEPCDAGTTQLSSPVCQRGGQQDPLGMCRQTKTPTIYTCNGKCSQLCRLVASVCVSSGSTSGIRSSSGRLLRRQI